MTKIHILQIKHQQQFDERYMYPTKMPLNQLIEIVNCLSQNANSNSAIE